MSLVEQEIETVNMETGEVTTQSKTVCKFKSDEPDYVKLYLKAWLVFKDVKGINTAFLYKLLPSMSYAEDGQYIYTNSAMKKNIAKELNWSEKTACQRASLELRKLCEQGVFKKIQNGQYQVNPELIGKGDWRYIRRLRAVFNLQTGEVEHYYEQEEEDVTEQKKEQEE